VTTLGMVSMSTACVARHTPITTPAPSSSARDARPSAAVRQLRADLDQVFGAPIAARGVWGVEVRSLATGERLFEQDAGKLMMPASNMKILTLAAAAETLGWDYRYTTTLESTGTIENGVLRGDLIVRGTGDPTINSRSDRAAHVLDEWILALTSAGIRQIDGRIIGNDQAFDDEGLGAGWAWDYLQYGYAAPVGALQYNEDVATLLVTPGGAVGAPATVRLDAGSGLVVLNRATTAPAGTETTIDYRRHLEQPLLEVTGMVAVGAAPVTRTVAVVNPTLFFVQSLKEALVARGIDVSGPAVDFDDVAPELAGATTMHDNPRVLASTTSPPLREIAVVLMKVSQNLYAETLLKTIGAARGGLGTIAAGQKVLRDLLKAWNVPDDSYVPVDGSGLSRYNYVTTETLATVLEHMYRDPRHHDAFVATLPIVGKDGTLATRMRRTRAEGNAVAKTGSISNVRSLSGFVRTRDGEMLVFSILANDFVIPSSTINWIADLAVETLSNFTRK
jgi:D-alanyl-D-alanine carboxypeptidase/D-alanyl-D-alanine-endopeptidase (penicillin-binding protein 4)